MDSSGSLIGINTAIYSPSGASAGVGFAIPVDTVSEQSIGENRCCQPYYAVGCAEEEVDMSFCSLIGINTAMYSPLARQWVWGSQSPWIP